ncbi:MAG: MBL fold metallo-hydrolase [Candidatus Zixiibacteriota bacterium]
MLKSFLLLILTIFIPMTLMAQDQSAYTTTKLTDHIYKLTADGGGYDVKVIASVGDNGLLIVDSGPKGLAKDLKKELLKLAGDIPQIIINTHEHIEHVAGNYIFSKEPLIIGHADIKNHLTKGAFLFDELPEFALPELSFNDSITVHFNGEDIKLVAYPGAHSGTDILVWFNKSKVACVGAISNGTHFPSVDGSGDVTKYPEIVKNVMNRLPEDAIIVPGHGHDGDMKQFRGFYNMLVSTSDIVRRGVAEGKDLEILQKDDVIADWKEYEGSYVDANAWIEYLVDGCLGNKTIDSTEEFLELMYHEIKDNGYQNAIEKFREIKGNSGDDYHYDDLTLFYIPYKLYANEYYDEAMAFLNLYNEEFPNGQYGYLSQFRMGQILQLRGDKKGALKHLKKSVELNPTEKAKAKIKELEGE